jgi:hypothetical protein
MVGNEFVISTQGEMDMLIQGGDKFGGEIVLGFLSDDLEAEAGNLDGLAFKSAFIAVRNIFSSPLNIAYFIGEKDNFCSGIDFSTIFGGAPIITNYSGFMYFPNGISYNGIYSVNGTGVQLSITPLNDLFYSSLYFYQDADLGSGRYSYDLRTMFNLKGFNLEFFAGGSFGIPGVPFGYYRAGLLFNAQTPTGGFIMQVGIPQYNPNVAGFGIDLLYILFEVNVKLGLLEIIPTVFLHPGFYTQQATGEAGLIDANFNFKLGDIQKSLACGGLEANVSVADVTLSSLTLKVSPYLKLFSPGVEWQFKVNATVFPYPGITEMFEGFIGIKAVF